MARWRSSAAFGGTGSLRLWPVLLILAAIVVLPTACVLWLLSDALESSRLAMRQRLSELYRGPLARAGEALEERWRRSLEALALRARGLSVVEAQRLFEALIQEGRVDGIILRDASGELLYPGSSREGALGAEPPELWERAERLEHVDGNAAAALDLFRALAEGSGAPEQRASARRAEARCLAKLGDRAGALAVLLDPAWDGADAGTRDFHGRVAALDAKLHALALLGDAKLEAFQRTAAGLAARLADYGSPCAPASQRRFLMRELRALWPGCPSFPTLEAEDLAAAHLESNAGDAEAGVLARSGIAGVWRYTSPERTLEALFREDGALASDRILDGRAIGDGIVDPAQARIAARPARAPPSGDPLASLACRAPLADWSLDLHLVGPDPLAQAASERVAARVWTACLVIALSVALAFAAARLIGRQMRLSRLKSDWTAAVTHELRTPLAGMRALVDTLLDESYRGREQAREYIRLIARENERLTRLIENFLTFSRIERDKVAFERTRVDPRQVLERAAELVRDKFAAEGHRFSVECSGPLPEILADAGALVTVLLNLIENAYKYSGAEKVVALRCSTRGDRVSFEVEDNGIGIPRSAQRRIFERFYQVDRSLTRGASGCGLGLSIVKAIVEAHGGVVRVDSAPGRGSTFTVELDALAAAPDAPADSQGAHGQRT
jgi:signal transduction histidine kinase